MSKSQDAALLHDIRTSFIKDGLQWSMESDKKLIHLWKKVIRTEEELRKSSKEVHQLRTAQKEELTNVQSVVEKIKELSQQKENITDSLEEENDALRLKLSQLTAENEMFIQESNAISQLFIAEGMQDSSGGIPKQPVQHLINERSELMEKIRKSDKEKIELVEQLERTRKELDRMKKGGGQEKIKLEKQLADCQVELEQTKAKLTTIKADHIKQHRMNQKQIHDLRDRISKSETKGSEKDEENSNIADQLHEATQKVALLRSELTRAREAINMVDAKNKSLCEELSRTCDQNEELSYQLEELNQEVSDDREKSISVLEEQLQKEHDLQNKLELTHRKLRELEKEKEELIKGKQELQEELEAKTLTLEQSLHDKQSVSLEKKLLQQAVSEKERAIEVLERELKVMEGVNQDLSQQNAAYEAEIDEQTSRIQDKNQRMLEAVKSSEMVKLEKTHLQGVIEGLEDDNNNLRESLEDVKRTSDRMKTEAKTLKEQKENQRASMDSQLSILQTEKEDLISLMEEESTRQDKVRESLNSTVSQLQDELYSKCEELSRAQLEIQHVLRESASLKQNLETEVVNKKESEQELKSLQSEIKSLHDKLAQMKVEMEAKENQAVASQQKIGSEKDFQLLKKDREIENKKREIETLQSKLKAVSKEADLNKAMLTSKLKATNEATLEEMGALQDRLDSEKEKSLALESELESKDTALREALQSKEALQAEKVSVEATLDAFQKENHASQLHFTTCKTALDEEKSTLIKEVDSQKKLLQLTQAECDAEKADLQAQVAALKSKKVSLEQQLQTTKSLFESEKSQHRTLKEDMQSKMLQLLAAQQELDDLKEQLASVTKRADESKNQVKVFSSSWNEAKKKIADKEKECELAQAEKAEMATRVEEMEHTLHTNEKKQQDLKDKLSKAVLTSGENEIKLQEKEKELLEVVSRLEKVESLLLEARETLEKAQTRISELERENEAAEFKSHEEIRELTEQNNTLQRKIKKLEIESAKLASTSRRYESKLAKKLKEVKELQEGKEKADIMIRSMQLEVPILRDKVVQLEKKATAEEEIALLREQFNQEKIEKLLKAQEVSALQERVAALEETQSELEAMIREKQDALHQSERLIKEQSNEVQKAMDKLNVMINEKETLEDEKRSLQENVSRYKSIVIQLRGKVERYKMKYKGARMHSRDRLASSMSEFSRERCNLESSIGSVKDELRTAKARLDCESKWKDTAENIHRKLLEEKSELTAKLVAIEERFHERGRQMTELEIRASRLQQENTMLDGKNKRLLNHHIQLSTLTPSSHDLSPTQQLNDSLMSSGGLQSLFASSPNRFSNPTPPPTIQQHHHHLLSPSPATNKFTTPTSPHHIKHSSPITPSTNSSTAQTTLESPKE